jgi:hypothetical protein
MLFLPWDRQHSAIVYNYLTSMHDLVPIRDEIRIVSQVQVFCVNICE